MVLLLLCSPARSLGLAILGEIFAYVTIFLNPTIEVVDGPSSDVGDCLFSIRTTLV